MMFDVMSELIDVIVRWKHIGQAFRLRPAQLDIIESDHTNPEDCLREILALWLKWEYNTERFGKPSWKLLAYAVHHRAGGNNPALAQMIIKKHEGILYHVSG